MDISESSSNKEGVENTDDRLQKAYMDFMSAATWEETRAAVEQNPELLREELDVALSLFVREMRKKGDDFNAAVTDEGRQLLKDCRERGIDQAFRMPERYQHMDMFRNMEKYAELMISSVLEAAEAKRAAAPDLEEIVDRAQETYSLYTQEGDVSALDECAVLCRDMIAHADFARLPQEIQLGLYDQVARTLLEHYWIRHDTEDLKLALKLREEVLAQTPEDSGDRSRHLDGLSICLRDYYHVTENMEDLNKSIQLSQLAVQKASTRDKDYYVYLNNLGNSLGERYRATSDITDLDNALQAWRESIRQTPAGFHNLFIYLKNLGAGLELRYDRSQKLEDKIEAVNTQRLAIRYHPPRSPHFQRYCSGFVDSLLELYEHDDQPGTLNEAVDLFLKLVKHGSEDLSLDTNVIHLRDCFVDRFERFGDALYLQKAVQVFQEAIALASPTNKNRYLFYSYLGEILRRGYEFSGEVESLHEGIGAYRKVLQLTPPGHPDLPLSLSNLAISLTELYYLEERQGILDESISLLQKAIDLTDTASVAYPRFLNNLMAAFNLVYEDTKRIADLDRCIETLRRSIEYTEPDSEERPARIFNMGQLLYARYLRTHDLRELDEAISCGRSAIEMLDSRSTDYFQWKLNVALKLRERYERMDAASDREEARSCFKEICSSKTVSPVLILEAGYEWGIFAWDLNLWDEALQSFEMAFDAYNQLFQGQLSEKSKQNIVHKHFKLVHYYTYLLSRNGNLSRAVEVIEQGRARLMAEKLQGTQPELKSLVELGHEQEYRNYLNAARELDEFVQSRQDQIEGAQSAASQVEKARIQKNLQDSIQVIQNIAGFENWFRPLSSSDVQAIAGSTPLVYLLHTAFGSLALVVTREEIKDIWLNDFEHNNQLRIWLGMGVEEWEALSHSERWNMDEPLTAEDDAKLMNGYSYPAWLLSKVPNLEITRDLWARALDNTSVMLGNMVMQPIVEYLLGRGFKSAIFVPSGIFSLVPLHLASIPDPVDQEARRFALDCLTLSLAPSARALQTAQSIAARVEARKLLVIDNPDHSLHYTREEVALILANFKDSVCLSGSQASLACVKEELSKNTVIHFATHGSANIADPLSNSLLLADGVITLADIFRLQLPGVRLAVLSACETSASGQELDEAVSLPGGFLQAGSGGIVATFWPVSDLSTAMVMARFYDLWLKEKVEPAYALQQAQIWLRDTTNREKKVYFQQTMPDAFSKYFEWQDPDARSFTDPYDWASFTYTGV